MSEWSYENVEMEVSGGTSSRWPDLFGAGNAPIVHEQVADTLTREKVTGFVAHPVTITKITNKNLLDRIPPRYYILEITGAVNLDLMEYGTQKNGHVCPACRSWVSALGVNMFREPRHRYIPDLQTWDGSDFVRIGNVALYWTLCSRKVIDLAGKNKWANFIFGHWIPEVGIPYQDPTWFDTVRLRVKAKNPSLFGLGEEQAKSLLPPKPETPSPSPPTQPKRKSDSEEYEEKVTRLQNPRFDLVEAHFKCTIPRPLKDLYQNKRELLRGHFTVGITLSEEAKEEAYISKIAVGHYSPIDGSTMAHCGEGMEDYIEFASDGIGGYYCVDPRESDPEVHVFIADGGDLAALGITLTEFLNAPRRKNR